VAHLEVINYTPMREVVSDGSISWVPDKLKRVTSKLPQIYWNDGEPWHVANHWAITKAYSTQGGRIKTVTSLMKHLAAYAAWLESRELDWRHFPIRKDHRAVVIYRGELIEQRERGSLAPSTVTARMRAVIQFYRHAKAYGFVERKTSMWNDRQVVIRYADTAGFERAITRIASDLGIPNRKRVGLRLEDGLTPLKTDDAVRLLEFTKEQGLVEINLMLSLGILAGARIETITSLSVRDIENAYPDPQTPHIYRMRVGPPTSVMTKFDVEGELMVPKFLIDDLKAYSYSVQRRLRRQSIASEVDRGLLFLTVRGNRYESASFNRLMTDLRRRALSAGLRFMDRFKFHQTRATYGTWLMGVAMGVASLKAAVAFVKGAMLHKDEKTTFLYVRFIEEAPIKAQVADEFSVVFSGVVKRDWNRYHA